jgi:hypothetical protein
MRSLTEITIKVENYDDDPKHVEITLQAPCVIDTLEDFGYPTTQQIIDGATHVANVLGRLAFVVVIDVMRGQGEHGCLPYWRKIDEYGYPDKTCHIAGSYETLTDPGANTGDPPAIWLYVPRESADQWVVKLRDLLACIANPTRAADDEPHLRAVRGGQP